jgi:hypothetical protein
MNFPREASKILTNKYFLYFMVFLASTNVLGYLVTNKINAVIFFALVSLLTYYFSKNYAVILLVALISTNFMMANKMMREGLEGQNTDGTTNTVLENVSSTDPQLGDALNAVKNARSTDEVKNKIQAAVSSGTASGTTSDTTTDTTTGSTTDTTTGTTTGTGKSVVDINNPNLNKTSGGTEPEGVGGRMNGSKKGKENMGPRLDYAATIDQSYQNLDEMLGSDSIKQLTNDTQKLMSQQQNLFNTMNQMVPVLEGAQNMLKGFDISSLTKSLKGAGVLGAAPTVVGSN